MAWPGQPPQQVANALGLIVHYLLSQAPDATVDEGVYFEMSPMLDGNGLSYGNWRIDIKRTEKP